MPTIRADFDRFMSRENRAAKLEAARTQVEAEQQALVEREFSPAHPASFGLESVHFEPAGWQAVKKTLVALPKEVPERIHAAKDGWLATHTPGRVRRFGLSWAEGVLASGTGAKSPDVRAWRNAKDSEGTGSRLDEFVHILVQEQATGNLQQVFDRATERANFYAKQIEDLSAKLDTYVAADPAARSSLLPDARRIAARIRAELMEPLRSAGLDDKPALASRAQYFEEHGATGKMTFQEALAELKGYEGATGTRKAVPDIIAQEVHESADLVLLSAHTAKAPGFEKIDPNAVMDAVVRHDYLAVIRDLAKSSLDDARNGRYDEVTSYTSMVATAGAVAALTWLLKVKGAMLGIPPSVTAAIAASAGTAGMLKWAPQAVNAVGKVVGQAAPRVVAKAVYNVLSGAPAAVPEAPKKARPAIETLGTLGAFGGS